MKDLRRFYQRCTGCKERAFEFLKNPAKGVIITEKDIRYTDEKKDTKPYDCQFCKRPVPRSEFGGDNLVAKEPPTYPKYKGSTPIHHQWYINGTNFRYKELVDASLKPFEGLKGTVLDIGSGDGLIEKLLQEKGFTVYGIEPEIEGIKAAMRMSVDFKTFHTTVEDYITKAMMPVDYLYSLNTIEHVNDPTAFIKVMESVKEFAIIVTDNAINKDGKRRGMKELHTKEFSYPELEELFKDFKTEKVDVNDGSFIGIKIYARK